MKSPYHLEHIKKQLLPKLLKHRNSYYFRDPVYVNDLDYYKIVKKPMCLRRVVEKLDSDQYKSGGECIEDILLIFSNCYMYNDKDSDVWEMGKLLERSFKYRLKRLPQNEVWIENNVKEASKIHASSSTKTKTVQHLKRSNALKWSEIAIRLTADSNNDWITDFIGLIKKKLVTENSNMHQLPTSIETVQDRLQQGYYKDPADFENDIRQLIDSSSNGNGLLCTAGKLLETIEHFFIEKWTAKYCRLTLTDLSQFYSPLKQTPLPQTVVLTEDDHDLFEKAKITSLTNCYKRSKSAIKRKNVLKDDECLLKVTSPTNNCKSYVSAAKRKNALSLTKKAKRKKIEIKYPKGMNNTGTYCYMISTLQAFYTCPLIKKMFERLNELRKRIKIKNTTTLLLDNTLRLYEELQTSKMEVIHPTYFYDMVINDGRNEFERGQHEDALGFFCYLFNRLDEELGIFNKRLVESKEIKNMEENQKNNDNLIVLEILPLLLTRTTTTREYENRPSGITRQSNYFLHIYLTNCKDIGVALKLYTSQVEHTDTVTGEKAVEQTLIEELPKILVLQPLVYKYDEDGRKKISDKITFNTEITIEKDQLTPEAAKRYNEEKRKYTLFAVVYHKGKYMDHGHYMAEVHKNLHWFAMSDQKVSQTTAKQVIKPKRGDVQPFLLFYQRSDL